MSIRKRGDKWFIDNVSGSFDTRREAMKKLKKLHMAKRKRRKDVGRK